MFELAARDQGDRGELDQILPSSYVPFEASNGAFSLVRRAYLVRQRTDGYDITGQMQILCICMAASINRSSLESGTVFSVSVNRGHRSSLHPSPDFPHVAL